MCIVVAMTKPTDHDHDYPALLGRFRQNLRMMRSLRDMTDQELADAAGYNSRQVIGLRTRGEVKVNLDDLARLGAALRVEPWLLLAEPTTLAQWVVEHPDYQGPDLWWTVSSASGRAQVIAVAEVKKKSKRGAASPTAVTTTSTPRTRGGSSGGRPSPRASASRQATTSPRR
jgi:transcriptional regulator with XRE-family HTH domain